MHPILFYVMSAIAIIFIANILFLCYLRAKAWHSGFFKTQPPVPLATLEVLQGDKIVYTEFSATADKTPKILYLGKADTLFQQAITHSPMQQLSPSEMANFIDAEGQSFWETVIALPEKKSGKVEVPKEN